VRISILYFKGCPNHPPVVETAKRIVAEYGLDAEVEEVEVASAEAERHRFLGSPTVQVDGVDIEPAARERTDFAMSCRVYGTADGRLPEAMLLEALGVGDAVEARVAAAWIGSCGCCGTDIPTVVAPVTNRAGFVAIGGSVVTAVLSSACCWLPLLLLAFGASAAGASAFFEEWRPVFILVAVCMLALGFYFGYFRKSAGGDECCGERAQRGRRLQRAMLWGSAVIVAAFTFLPNYIGVLLNTDDGSNGASAASVANGREYVFDIEGMHCDGCATTLRSALVKLDGVIAVDVDYGTKTARVFAGGQHVPEQVAEVTAGVGCTATLLPEGDAALRPGF
jgi:copper chaperone CopZ